MGCNGSKSTGTENSTKNTGEANEEQTDVVITHAEAVAYLQSELGISEDRAKKMVDKMDKNSDDKIKNDELIKMQGKIKEIKAEIRGRFEKYDKDNSGKVTVAEAVEVLKEKFPGVNEDSLKAMAQRYDMDGKGKIDYDEFVYFYANVSFKKEELKVKWREMDKDLSGTLTSYECSKLLEDECAIDEKMAKSLFEDFDKNKDGKINREEFEKLFVSLFG